MCCVVSQTPTTSRISVSVPVSDLDVLRVSWKAASTAYALELSLVTNARHPVHTPLCPNSNRNVPKSCRWTLVSQTEFVDRAVAVEAGEGAVRLGSGQGRFDEARQRLDLVVLLRVRAVLVPVHQTCHTLALTQEARCTHSEFATNWRVERRVGTRLEEEREQKKRKLQGIL